MKQMLVVKYFSSEKQRQGHLIFNNSSIFNVSFPIFNGNKVLSLKNSNKT